MASGPVLQALPLRLESVSPFDAPDALEVDGQGDTQMPGLIDMHQHIMLDLGTSAGTND